VKHATNPSKNRGGWSVGELAPPKELAVVEVAPSGELARPHAPLPRSFAAPPASELELRCGRATDRASWSFAVDRASSLPAPHPAARASSSCPAPPWPQPGRVRRAAVGKGLCGSRLGWEAIDRSSKQRLGRSPVFVWRQTPEV